MAPLVLAVIALCLAAGLLGLVRVLVWIFEEDEHQYPPTNARDGAHPPAPSRHAP